MMKHKPDVNLAKVLIRDATIALARREMREFIEFTYDGWESSRHHDALFELADRLVHGKNQRIMISLPPRHSKSEIFSIRLPAYFLGVHPDRQIIHVSYSSNLSNTFSRQIRQLVRDSASYRTLFTTRLDQERTRIDDWKTTLGGGFKSTGIGGGLTGHGCDLLIIDDPVKEGDENSPTTLQQHYEWYNSAARTRLLPDANIVIVMTRWHTRDLVGRLRDLAEANESADQWDVVELPALADSDDDPLGRELGEPLWAARFDRDALEAVRVMSDRYWMALYQQKPLDEMGATFERGWFNRFNVIPELERQSGAWCFDLALSKDDRGDYSVFGRWIYSDGVLWVHRIHQLRDNWHSVKERIIDLMNAHPHDKFVFPTNILELAAVQDLKYHKRVNNPRQLVEVSMKGDKDQRARLYSDRAASGRAYVEVGAEGDAFINEHALFPDEHDDFVDMSSVACHYFGLHEEVRVIARGDDEQRARLIAREKHWAKVKSVGGWL
jgi:phage terminase large subunit-like protein